MNGETDLMKLAYRAALRMKTVPATSRNDVLMSAANEIAQAKVCAYSDAKEAILFCYNGHLR